jgi:hypothetical protein
VLEKLPAVALGVLIALSSGCGSDEPSASGSSTRAGMGTSTGAPTGTAVDWPAGVTFGTIKGDDSVTECLAAPEYGGETLVELCVPVVATEAVSLAFPAGLVFVSSSAGTMNGVILDDLPVGAGPGTTHLVIKAFSLNRFRAPSDESDTYSVGPDTNDAAVAELIALVAGKNVQSDGAVAVIQDALWSITDGSGLTPQDRSAIAALP